jgi:lambda family phage minor tail protein L
LSTAHITEAQKLATSAMVELFTLDTSTCLLSSQPGGHSVGEVYRWCAGTADQREIGVLAATAPSQTVVTLERAVPYDPASTYVFAVENPATGGYSAATTVQSISGATVTLAFPLGFVPTAEMKWGLFAQRAVKFGGVTYQALPIQATGFEWNGQGKLPRPKLRIANISGLVGGLLIAFGDLLGATLTRTRTMAKFLDGAASADATAYFEPDVFRVDRLGGRNKRYVEFELATAIDQLGLRLPGRVMLRNACSFTYRKRVGGSWVPGTCPYAGAGMFKLDGTPTLIHAEDACDHHMTGCLLRYGVKTPLPIAAFPGLALVRT